MRSTPAAALLTGLTALTAVAGCVAVSPGPGPGPDEPGPVAPGPAVPLLPRPHAAPPGREELATIGPVPRPVRTTPSPSSATPEGTARPAAPAPDGPASTAPREAEAARPAPARPPRTAPPPAAPEPAASSRASVDVCALGEEYGRWARDSPEAAICAEHFGR